MIDVESDDEDTYFTPVSSSNLALLFNTTMLPLNQDKSLTFKPVKQPKPIADQQHVKTVKVESAIIIFKEIYAFQMKDQKEYLSFGRCGLALLGNDAMSIYSLLIYRNKDNIISTTKPCSSFEVTIKQNNYISYTDDKNTQWTLNFNCETDISEFIHVLTDKCKCKINKIHVNPVRDVAEVRDIKSVTSNESDVKSDCFHNCAVEQEPSISSEDQNKSVGDISEKSDSVKSATDVKSSVSGFYSAPRNVDSDTSDSSEAVKSKKADILNRVAKMGKKLFDNEQGDVTDSSDVDDKSKNRIERKSKGKASKHSFIKKNINHPVELQHTQINCTADTLDKIMVPYQDNKTMISTAISSDQLNMFFIENKHSASEIKLNIMKLQNDMGEVLKIVKKNEFDCRSMSTQTDNETLLEENQKLLVLISQQNDTLEKLKEGNESLRTTNEEIVTKATENAYKIASLIENNAELNSNIYDLNLKINEQDKLVDSLNQKIESLQPSDDQVILNKSILNDCEIKIKEHMNLFYQEACENFEDEEQYDGKAIKKHLAQTIIHNTFSVLKAIKEIFDN